ncbi:MAG: hypothetical protein V1723_03530 [Candidatus Uhrbacteria bacterium]
MLVSVVFTAGAWIAMCAVPRVGNEFILHYTTVFGIDAVGPWADLFRLPAFGTVLLVANTIIARLLIGRTPSSGSTTERPSSLVNNVGVEVDAGLGYSSADLESSDLRLDGAVVFVLVATIIIELSVFIGSLLLWRANTA